MSHLSNVVLLLLSQVHAALVKDQTLVKSWNGERCDVRPFEKLSEPANVLLAKDLRVVSLKDASVFPSGLQVTDVKVRFVLVCEVLRTENIT